MKRLAFLLALALGCAPTLAEERSPAGGGGSLAWVADEDLDLVGDLWADLAFPVSERSSLLLGASTRSALRIVDGAPGDRTFRFQVRDLHYDLRVAAERRLGPSLRGALIAGQWGREGVDAPAAAWVRWAGVALSSAPAALPVRFRVAGGPVVSRHGVDAEGVLLGAAEMRLPLGSTRARWGGDIAVQALLGGESSGEVDIEAGPAIEWQLAGGDRTGLFVHVLEQRTPLGLGLSGVSGGFRYARAPGVRRDGTGPGAPRLSGRVAASGGDAWRAGRLEIDVTWPPVLAGWTATIAVDANVLAGRSADELYYLYDAGFERHGGWLVPAIAFYHRSNHRLRELGDHVTSINVAEVGVETAGWGAPHELTPRLDWRARVGALLGSSFGEERDWHARGGVRWVMPWCGREACPLVEATFEEGDVRRRTAEAGVLFRSGLSIGLEYRSDEQLFGSDKTALLVTAGVRL